MSLAENQPELYRVEKTPIGQTMLIPLFLKK